MSDSNTVNTVDSAKHRPFVPEHMEMKEFTLRAVLLGLVMTIVLGAANAYLGLRAGITIAATYPAAVVGMAILRALKGTVLGRISLALRAPSGRALLPARSSPFPPSS